MAVLELRNDSLTVQINTLGAELMSVKDKAGDEYIWQGDPNVWKYRAPICFPVCGEFNGGAYTYEGKEYRMSRHGFARDMEFEVLELGAAQDGSCKVASRACVHEEKKSEEVASVSFVLESTEETLACYPFDFVLTVTYELSGKALIVTYKVENKTSGEMYFSIGSHEGYTCPGGIFGYSVYLDEIIPLVYEYFEGPSDTLVYEKPEVSTAVLKEVYRDVRVTVDFDAVDTFSIWTKRGGDFICLEPWHGISEEPGTDPDISKKPGFVKLEEGKEFTTWHRITFGE